MLIKFGFVLQSENRRCSGKRL